MHVLSIAANIAVCAFKYNQVMAHDHDTTYKQLFSHSEMVRDLLIGFVPGEWIKDIDFTTLTQESDSYVSATQVPQQRHSDLVG